MGSKHWTPPNLDSRDKPDWDAARLSALVYVIGVLLRGDGSVFVYKSGRSLASGKAVTYLSHAIQLQVSSLEFAAHFNSRCSPALGRATVGIRGTDSKGMFFVTYRNLSFGRWWSKQNLSTLKPFIEAYPLDYIRGRFDSDANVDAYSVTPCGAESHREVMEYHRSLCSRLGTRVGEVAVYDEKGSQTYIEGRLVTRRRDKLRFHVNAGDFLRIVGG